MIATTITVTYCTVNQLYIYYICLYLTGTKADIFTNDRI